MPTVVLENVWHVVDFEPSGKGRRRGMLTEKAMHEYRAASELSVPTHAVSGLRHLRMDDFGLIVRGAWWLILQMACDSPRRGWLLRYAGDGRIEPMRARHVATQLNMRAERAEEICELLGPACAGVLETVRRYELVIDDAERTAYEAARQGELFTPPKPAPDRVASPPRVDADLARWVEEEWIAGKRKPLQAEATSRIASALGPLCRDGRPGSEDILQWETIVVRCMTIPSRRTKNAPTPAEIAVRIAGVIGKAQELATDCAVRGDSPAAIRNAPAVLAAWARKEGFLRGTRGE